MNTNKISTGPSLYLDQDSWRSHDDDARVAPHYTLLPIEETDRLEEELRAAMDRPTPRYLEISRLLKRGANPNCRNHDGWTPLTVAARYGHRKIATLLVQYGASVDNTDNDGSTPLMRALEAGHTMTAEFLLKRGANPYHENYHGETPTSVAVDPWTHKLMIKALIADFLKHTDVDTSLTPSRVASLSEHISTLSERIGKLSERISKVKI